MESARPGFTIIELLIVVSIIAVITASVLPNFNNYLNNQNLRQAVEMIKDDFRTVQNRALNGEESTTEIGGVRVGYWGVQYSQNSQTYQYFISTINTGCSSGAITRQNIKTSTRLPGDLVVRSANGCIYVSFNNAENNFVPAAIATIIVGPPAPASTGCRRISISSAGLITVENETVNGCTL